jgi:hypothetical protein
MGRREGGAKEQMALIVQGVAFNTYVNNWGGELRSFASDVLKNF